MVRDILKDIRYTGAVAQGMYKSDVIGSGRGRKVPREQWHITQGCHEAIVSPEEFEQVQRMFENNPKPPAGTKKAGMTEKRPLAGKVRCGGCGYVLARSSGKTPVYSCRHKLLTDAHTCLSGSVKASAIEDAVAEALRKLFDVFAAGQARRKEREGKRAAAAMSAMREKQALQKQIAAVQNNKLALYNRYSDGEIGKDGYFRLREESEARMRELSEQAAALEYANAAKDVPADAPVMDTVKGLRFEGRLTHEIVDALIDSVTVHGADRIDIEWKFADMMDESDLHEGESHEAG